MENWFAHKDGMCFNLTNATGFLCTSTECHIYYNGSLIHPTLIINQIDHPEKFDELSKLYSKITLKTF